MNTDQIQNQVAAERFDVIVIGSGFAGLAAAIEAKRAGASVCVIEKTGSLSLSIICRSSSISAPLTTHSTSLPTECARSI